MSCNSINIEKYGKSDQQFFELYYPDNVKNIQGGVVLIHGGYWRAKFNLELMHDLASNLVAQGWVVANLEYRRLGNGGGWPITIEDVKEGVHKAHSLLKAACDEKPIIGIGHSVGGQLVLLAHHQLDAVIALAPVTDLTRAYHERLGDDAVSEFMVHPPSEIEDDYAEASPMSQLPIGVPALIIHGDNDDRVPVTHSRDFFTEARAVSKNIRFWEIPGLDHFDIINPATSFWSDTHDWMLKIPISLTA
ncbi:alpha/beta hydrolase family protein [Oceanisphaera sp.]|uniref:alpha/beta hydrolase family protein n=1 Tax=Oceanisphaera sp. TaxID=1929979 RepID=UPI003A937EDF